MDFKKCIKTIIKTHKNYDICLIREFKIINKPNVKLIKFSACGAEIQAGYHMKGYKCNSAQCFQNYWLVPKIIRPLIKIQCIYYFNDTYKTILYLILKNVFGRDLSKYIIQIMSWENKEEIKYKLHWYDKLCKLYDCDPEKNGKFCVNELFTIFKGLSKLKIKI